MLIIETIRYPIDQKIQKQQFFSLLMQSFIDTLSLTLFSFPNCSAGFPILMAGTQFCFHAGRPIAEKAEVMPARQLETREY